MGSRRAIKETLIWAMTGASFLLLAYNTLLYRGSRHGPALARMGIETGASLGEFTLKGLDGTEFALSKNRRYLVSFLTTVCPACQTQVHGLNRVAESGKYDRVIGVFFETRKSVEQFKATFAPEFSCLYDPGGKLNTRLNLSTFPQTIELIDGKVNRGWVGSQESFD
jgi:peroxiredoxin